MSGRAPFPVTLEGVEDFYFEGLERCRPIVVFSEWDDHLWSPSQGSGSGHGMDTQRLLLAAFSGDVEGGKQAVHNGADVRTEDKQGICPLMIACQEGHMQFVNFLIEHGAFVTQCTHRGRTALFYAVISNHLDLARLLLESDPTLVNMADEGGMTALMLCALKALCDMMALLREFRADLNIQDKQGRTALMAAGQLGHLDAVRYLVENGAQTGVQCNTGATALLIALSHAHLQVTELLMNEVDVKISDSAGNSLLLLSCSQGQTDIIKHALQLGADVNQTNKNGITPVMAAVCHGQKDIVRLLLQHKPDMNIKNTFEMTALDLAVLWKNDEIVNLLPAGRSTYGRKSDIPPNRKAMTILVFLKENVLLERFVKDKSILYLDELCNDHTPLMIAAHSGNVRAIQILLEKGANVNMQSSKGTTALAIAIAKDHVAAFERLLEYGADINLGDDQGETMLFKCAARGNLDSVVKLERMGANVDKRNKNGDTPLMAAAQYGHVDIAKYLWKVCAQLDTKNLNVCTALDVALIYEQHEVASLLHGKHDNVLDEKNTQGQMLMQVCQQADHIQAASLLADGAPANFRDPEHNMRTPLMCAAQSGVCEIVELLIKHGASVHTTSVESETALFFACLNGHTEVARYLLDQFANLNIQDDVGHTPLMCASQNGHLDIVKALVEQRALISVKDRNEMSALIFATQSGHADIVQYLLDTGFAHVDTVDHRSRTVLFLSCISSNIETVRVLLDHNADIDSQINEKKKTPLMAAVETNNLEMVRYLVERGASLEKIDHHGNLAHELADIKYYTDIHVYLVEKYAEQRARRPLTETGDMLTTERENRTQRVRNREKKIETSQKTKAEAERNLLDMCTKDWGFEDLVKFNVEAGADINCKDAHGRTPILVAAKKGYFKYIPWLITYGADVNCQDENGCTPLMFALRNEEYAAIFLILEGTSGTPCEVNLKDHMGTTALMMSIHLGMYEIAEKILQQTTNVNVADANNNTVLSHCAMNPRTEASVLYLLIEKHSNVNCINCNGDTPLLIALRHGNGTMVKLLLDQNVDLVHKNHWHEDALILVCHKPSSPGLMDQVAPYQEWFEADSVEVALRVLVINDHVQLLDILLGHGLDVTRSYRHGKTLAFFAAEHGHVSTLEKVLGRGADVNHQDEEGQTVLMLACGKDDVKAVRTILKYQANVCLENRQGLTAVDIALACGQRTLNCFTKENLPQHGEDLSSVIFVCDLETRQTNTSEEMLSPLGSSAHSLHELFDLFDPTNDLHQSEDIYGINSRIKLHNSWTEDPDPEAIEASEKEGSTSPTSGVTEGGRFPESSVTHPGDLLCQTQVSEIQNSLFIEEECDGVVSGGILSGGVVSGATVSELKKPGPRETDHDQALDAVDFVRLDVGFQGIGNETHDNMVEGQEVEQTPMIAETRQTGDSKTTASEALQVQLGSPETGLQEEINSVVSSLKSQNMADVAKTEYVQSSSMNDRSASLMDKEHHTTDQVCVHSSNTSDQVRVHSSNTTDQVCVRFPNTTDQVHVYSSNTTQQVCMNSCNTTEQVHVHSSNTTKQVCVNSPNTTGQVRVHSSDLKVHNSAEREQVPSPYSAEQGQVQISDLTEQVNDTAEKVHVHSHNSTEEVQVHSHNSTGEVHVHSHNSTGEVHVHSHNSTEEIHVHSHNTAEKECANSSNRTGNVQVHSASSTEQVHVHSPNATKQSHGPCPNQTGKVHVHSLNQRDKLQTHSVLQTSVVPGNPSLCGHTCCVSQEAEGYCSCGDKEQRQREHVHKTSQMEQDNSEERHQVLNQLRRALDGKERVIGKQAEKLADYEKQIAELQTRLCTDEQKLTVLQAKLVEYETGRQLVKEEQTQLVGKVRHIEQLLNDTLSENQVLRLQRTDALEQEQSLKDQVEVLKIELEARDQTIATLQREQRGVKQYPANFTKPVEDKLGKWQICACKKDSCPTCVAEKAATATQPATQGDIYWDEPESDDPRIVNIFREVKPDVSGVSRKFVFLFHMSISDSVMSDHAHPNCSASSISALLFAHRHLTNPCTIYTDFVSDFIYEQVRGSISDASEVFKLNFTGRTEQLLPADSVLVNSHLGLALKEDFEMDTMIHETLVHYMMTIEEGQILLFYRLNPYQVYSIIVVEGGQKLLILDPQWHSLKKRNGEVNWHGAFLYYSVRDVEVLNQTLTLFTLYSGQLRGKCRLAVVDVYKK